MPLLSGQRICLTVNMLRDSAQNHGKQKPKRECFDGVGLLKEVYTLNFATVHLSTFGGIFIEALKITPEHISPLIVARRSNSQFEQG